MKKMIITGALLMLPFLTKNNTTDNDSEQNKTDKVIAQKVHTNYLDTLMKQIPIHEGTRFMPYSCSAGHITVGCGHVIKKTDRFTFPLTQIQVDSILKQDILTAYYLLEVNTDSTIFSKLKRNEKASLAHFIFCKGIGSYNKSTLKKKVNSFADSTEIKKEFEKWVYYHTPSGKLVKSEWCAKIREFEIKLWNYGNN